MASNLWSNKGVSDHAVRTILHEAHDREFAKEIGVTGQPELHRTHESRAAGDALGRTKLGRVEAYIRHVLHMPSMIKAHGVSVPQKNDRKKIEAPSQSDGYADERIGAYKLLRSLANNAGSTHCSFRPGL